MLVRFSAVHMGLPAVFVGGAGMLFGFLVVAVIVVVSGLKVMMLGRGMVAGCGVMMLRSRMLVYCHGIIPYKGEYMGDYGR